jgi:hypothetical protein
VIDWSVVKVLLICAYRRSVQNQHRRLSNRTRTFSPRCRHLIDSGLPVQRPPKLHAGTLLPIGHGVSSPLDGYKATLSPPHLRLATSFLLLYPSTHKRPPSSPPCSLAPVSGAPLASCGAASRPLQSPFCLRLTHHIPAASCSYSITLRYVVASAACN